MHFGGFLNRIRTFQRRPQIDLGSVFKLPLSILKFGGITGRNRGIQGVYSLFRSTGLARSLPLARSPGKSGGKTNSQAASPVARLGVEVQVRWRDLESARKSGGGFWSRATSPVRDLWSDWFASLTASLATGLVVRLQVSPPDLRADSKFRHRTCTSTPSRATGLAA